MTYKLSIITINYNNAEGLEKTLQSVINQSSKDFEYIVVDGKSSDSSKELIAKNNLYIHNWISEPDSGVYNAMNKGIKMSSGEYLLFLNSGDQLADGNVIEKILPFLRNADLISGNLIYSLNDTPQTIFTPPQKINLAYFLHSFLPHPSTFIKRNLFEKTGFYNENLKVVSDWEFFLKASVIYQAKYMHIDEVISDFDNSGLSSNPENEHLIQQEKQWVYESLFPNLKEEIELIKFAGSKRMQQIQYISKNHSFLWKLLKGFLNILNIFSSQKQSEAFRKIQ
ncbi:glycosyltransferase family 2 protein [Chryseobacterium echinoideorum]|uniref:glycosyltransferase family 2 protein n=1 Tax=Chryseobacterium echinoideorum TaxID=1549648 RepID=UPI001184BB6A|nr:glycosyltransferase family 2 protein [Chryseobacterium echinoideorum]